MLDLQTLTFSSVVATSISALFFIVVWQMNRNEKGVTSWLVSLLLQPFGWTMLSMRGHWSDWLSIVAANTLIFSGFLLFLTGACQFWNYKQLKQRYVIVTILCFMSIFSFYTFVTPNIHIRIWLMYSATAAVMTAGIFLVFKLPKVQRTIGVKVFAFFCSLILTLTVLRVLTAEIMVPISTLFELNLSNFIGALLGFIIPYGIALCTFLLCNERKVHKVYELEQKSSQEKRLKNTFLAVLSHELRTPLNGMMGKAQLISDRVSDPHIKADCHTIVESGQALAELTNLVLEYSSSESPESITLDESEVNLYNYLTHIISLLEPLALKKNITLLKQFDIEQALLIKLDHNKLRLVLINLVGNAIKYTDKGSVTLKITSVIAVDSVNLLIEVIDTGIGIPDNEQCDLLTPFKKASNRSSKHEGVGLGLALTNLIVRTLKSKLIFESELGVGSVFKFSLIAKLAELENHSSSTNDEKDASNLTVLLIEDLEINQEIASNFLQQFGHKVFIADTGKSALMQLQQRIFDVVIIDMLLPDMHGTQLYQEIIKTYMDVPVIALTASVTESDLENYRQLGIEQVISKPLIKDKLKIAINNCITVNKIRPESTASTLNDDTIFDPEPLCFLIENMDKDSLEKIITSLPKTLSDYRDQLMSIMKEENLGQWIYVWHKLSGFCAQIGLKEFANYCQKFEYQTTVQHLDFHIYEKLSQQGILKIKAYWTKDDE